MVDGVYFAAAAERESSTYDDGEVVDSAIGRMDASSLIFAQIYKVKVEGLVAAKNEACAQTFLAVTDSDDSHIPSEPFPEWARFSWQALRRSLTEI